MPVRILIADDHDVVREGVKTILRSRPEWEICAEVTNGREAVESVKALHPDVAILDISMPGMSGFDATRAIRKVEGDTRVLILTMHDTTGVIKAAKEVGARGLVFKSQAARDLIPALEVVLAGGAFFGPNDVIRAKQEPGESGGPRILRSVQAVE